MSKTTAEIQGAIAKLNIKKPYDLRAHGRPTLKAPEVQEQVQTKAPQKEAAQVEGPYESSIQGKGYFTLERAIFEDPVIRALTGESFVVFIWLSVAAWSHANSTGRVRASIDYIVLKTGVSRSTVSRALKDLKDRQLIVCVEQNFKLGNMWQVSSVAKSQKDHQKEAAQNQPAQNQRGGDSKRGTGPIKLEEQVAQNEADLSFSQTSENHSQPGEELDEIGLYLKELLAPKKREAEEIALTNLLKSAGRSDVLQAFKHLKRGGFRFHEKHIHSPLSFLTYTIGEVLNEAKRRGGSQGVAIPKEAQISKDQVLAGATEFKKEQSIKWERFCEQFPEETLRDQEIDRLLGGSGSGMAKELRRILAMEKWG
jgi:hypothetical protein